MNNRERRIEADESSRVRLRRALQESKRRVLSLTPFRVRGYCPVCGGRAGDAHSLTCDHRGLVRRQRMYYIEFNLSGVEGKDEWGRVVYRKGRWPILFGSERAAREFVQLQGEGRHLFRNMELAGIRSASIRSVVADV